MATLSSGAIVNLTTDMTNAIIERYMAGEVLKIAEKTTIFYPLCKKVKLPPGESKTFTFQRFNRINPPRQQLSEGVTPLGQSMTVDKVTAIAEQWGAFITLSDVSRMTVRHDPWKQATTLMGLNAAETVDREIQRVMLAGTQVFYPNGKTARSSLTTGDTVNTDLLRKVRATLKNNGTPGFMRAGRARFVGVCDPFVSQDIMADTTFVESAKFQNLQPLTSGEFGEWMGISWQESNHIPVLYRHASLTADAAAPASAGSETALPNATYTVVITGNDSQGFESVFQASAHASQSAAIASSSHVVAVTVPAAVSGVVSYNVYCSAADDTSAFYLQAEDVVPGATVTITGGTPVDARTSASDTAFAVQLVTSGVRTVGVQPPASVNVHQSYVFGPDYVACGVLEDIKVMTTPDSAQKGDELNQRRSVGWKAFFKAIITTEAYGCRIESESAFD